jgi:Tol biopolymer transport system component
MGEVYRAQDTRLDRAVAIKVLPQEFAADATRRQRFEREARLIASLSHPHICALHDVGSEPAGGEPVAYLVMEYLEGATLADRLERGPLSPAETARYGRDMAAALAAAHGKQIVHRDLKPANVMLTRSGVKLLDFGLAAPAFPAAPAATATDAGRITMPAMVMGTLPYMAPEQVEGRATDHRTDIFALGAVLHEMVTGRRAFAGDTSASLASAILTSDPAPLAASSALDRIVRGCLEKDPERRWQSAQDVSRMLAGIADGEEPVAQAATDRRREWLPWAIAATAVVAAAGMWIVRGGQGRAPAIAPAAPVTFPIPPPQGARFLLSVENTSSAVSPDGSRIAFAAADEQGRRIWIRALGELEARPLAGTDNATSMFWSPDGRHLAFFAEGRLKRIDTQGGAAVTICPVREGVGQTGTWSSDGTILFASVQGEAILTVPSAGGTPAELVRPDAGRKENRVAFPSFLPDGKRFLYLAAQADDAGAVMLAGGGTAVELVRSRSNAAYVDTGYLLFAQDSTLVAQRFDPEAARVEGDVRPVASPINRFHSTGVGNFSASRSGNVIVLQSHIDEHQLAWFDRSGKKLSDLSTTGSYLHLRLSPDDREASVSRLDRRLTTWDLWLLNFARGNESKLTQAPGTEIAAVTIGRRWLIYSSTGTGSPQLVRRDLASGRDESFSGDNQGMQWASDASPDGEWVLYNQRSSRGTYDVMMRHISDGRVLPYMTTAADETQARMSPDGRFVTFSSDQSGTSEIYLARFPNPGAPVMVSAGGGISPRWSRDGREILYLSGQGVMAVRMADGAPADKPVLLFGPVRWNEFDVARDGRLLAVVLEQLAAEGPLTAILNWPAVGSR